MKVSQSPGFGARRPDPLDDEQPRARRVGVITSAAEVPCGRRRVLRRAARTPPAASADLQAAGREAAAARGAVPGPAGAVEVR